MGRFARAMEIVGDVVFLIAWAAVVLCLPLWFLLPAHTWYLMMLIIIPIWIATLIRGYNTGLRGNDSDSLVGGSDSGE